MNRLRILHNGDLRADTASPSPHWMVYVTEEGSVSGEVLTRGARRHLPKDFRVSDPATFFDIPDNLRQHQLQISPHHEEIIVTLVDPSGHYLGTFLLSQVPADSPTHAAIYQLVHWIHDLANQLPA